MPFKKGQSGNPAGRKPGTLNKTTRSIKAAFEAAFYSLQRDTKANRDAKAKLATWARENPGEFYKLAARLIPQEVRSQVQFSNVDVSGFTDDELALIAAGNATNELITRLIASARSSSTSGA